MSHFINKSCVKCGACLGQCPTDSIIAAEPIFIIDADTCTDCKCCIPSCPVSAFEKLPQPT